MDRSYLKVLNHATHKNAYETAELLFCSNEGPSTATCERIVLGPPFLAHDGPGCRSLEPGSHAGSTPILTRWHLIRCWFYNFSSNLPYRILSARRPWCPPVKSYSSSGHTISPPTPSAILSSGWSSRIQTEPTSGDGVKQMLHRWTF